MQPTMNEIQQDPDRFAAVFENHEPDQSKIINSGSLSVLSEAVSRRNQADEDIAHSIDLARNDRHSWAAVGAVLGTTGEAARQKYKNRTASSLVDRLPLTRMQKGGWLSAGLNKAELRREAHSYLDGTDAAFFSQVAARRSNRGDPLSGSQLAWLLRVRRIATATAAPHPFDATAARNLAESLATMSVSEPHMASIPERLLEVGIRLIIVGQLPDSKIDGATFWLRPNSPVIALSLRFNRIDHFWFTLLHELAHLLLGHVDPEHVVIDDPDDHVNNEHEDEADKQASRWAVLNYDGQLPDDFNGVLRLSKELGISPGIILGQLHHQHERTGQGLPYGSHAGALSPVRHIFSGAS